MRTNRSTTRQSIKLFYQLRITHTSNFTLFAISSDLNSFVFLCEWDRQRKSYALMQFCIHNYGLIEIMGIIVVKLLFNHWREKFTVGISTPTSWFIRKIDGEEERVHERASSEWFPFAVIIRGNDARHFSRKGNDSHYFFSTFAHKKCYLISCSFGEKESM